VAGRTGLSPFGSSCCFPPPIDFWSHVPFNWVPELKSASISAMTAPGAEAHAPFFPAAPSFFVTSPYSVPIQLVCVMIWILADGFPVLFLSRQIKRLEFFLSKSLSHGGFSNTPVRCSVK
jgi:hypothetical protein